MTTKRLVILLVSLLTLGTVFALPKQLQFQPLGIKLELPADIGEWHGEDEAITKLEIQTLGEGTEFARKKYTNGLGDELFVTIVLAGQDMNTSIHRPERCLIAQGWTMVGSEPRPVSIPDRGTLKTTRLKIQYNAKGNNGQPVVVPNLNYYWFTGCTDNTASHWERTRIDVSDRLLHGYNQRWAYFTVSGTITQGLKPPHRTEEETDAMIKSFIEKLVPENHLPSVNLAGK